MEAWDRLRERLSKREQWNYCWVRVSCRKRRNLIGLVIWEIGVEARDRLRERLIKREEWSYCWVRVSCRKRRRLKGLDRVNYMGGRNRNL